MKLLGFNFDKVCAERYSVDFKDRKIETNMDISDIKLVDSSMLMGKEDVLGLEFKYTLNYKPNIAKISLGGNILISEDSKVSKEILKSWESKKLPTGFKLAIFNIILRKCHIRALSFEEEMNLPYHITIPSLGIKTLESGDLSKENQKDNQKSSKKK